jgi:osmotically-inducible protein OsmY
MRKLITLVGLGAAFKYFLDPQSGAARRAQVSARVRDLLQQRRLPSQAAAQQSFDDPDDTTLARKVETEIFRDPDVPKGQINVNAEDGVVILRGEVERPELIEDLEEKTRSVQGVKGVENLLHIPGAEAEMHQAH